LLEGAAVAAGGVAVAVAAASFPDKELKAEDWIETLAPGGVHPSTL